MHKFGTGDRRVEPPYLFPEFRIPGSLKAPFLDYFDILSDRFKFQIQEQEYNKTFLTEEPLMFKLKMETEGLLCTFAFSFMLSNHIKGSDVMCLDVSTEIGYLPIKDIYIGLRQLQFSKSMSKEGTSHTRTLMSKLFSEFYQEFINQVQIRFDFSAPIFKNLVMLEPCKAANMEPSMLIPFFHFYSSPDWDKKRIESVLRSISTLDIPFKLLESPLLFERKILSMKTPCGSLRFKNLQKVSSFTSVFKCCGGKVVQHSIKH